jgi:phenylacetic acid degradation operon negative regulatory protein
LNLLLWTADKLARPTFRNLTDSYEEWAYRNGLTRQLSRLEKEGLIECDPTSGNDRLYRLTELGRLCVLGGRDPEAQWSRSWDGKWRLVLFDVPVDQHVHRSRLLRYLRSRGFGCLQGSVWVTPDPMHTEREVLSAGEINVESLLLLEARPCAGESDEEIVAGAWDFKTINQHYSRHLEILEQFSEASLNAQPAARTLQRWGDEERSAWQTAVALDPLLPKRLLPADYLGCIAWQKRIQVLGHAGEKLKQFSRNKMTNFASPEAKFGS